MIDKLESGNFMSVEYKRFYTKTKSGYVFDPEVMIEKINEIVEEINTSSKSYYDKKLEALKELNIAEFLENKRIQDELKKEIENLKLKILYKD